MQNSGAEFCMLYLLWMGALCRPYKAIKNANTAISTKFSHFAGVLVPIPVTDLGQIWQETEDPRPRSTLTHQISFESVDSVTFQVRHIVLPLRGAEHLGKPTHST